jgi:hypothetical protein
MKNTRQYKYKRTGVCDVGLQQRTRICKDDHVFCTVVEIGYPPFGIFAKPIRNTHREERYRGKREVAIVKEWGEGEWRVCKRQQEKLGLLYYCCSTGFSIGPPEQLSTTSTCCW